mgnify:CR=1 FL=1
MFNDKITYWTWTIKSGAQSYDVIYKVDYVMVDQYRVFPILYAL